MAENGRIWARILGEIRRLSPQKGLSKFESCSLRHRVLIINNLSFTFQTDSHFRPNFWIFARKGYRREFSAFFSFLIIPFDSLDLNSADPFGSMIRSEAKSFETALCGEI